MPSIACFDPDAAPIEEQAPADYEPEVRPQPDPEWIRGSCPRCGQFLVSKCHYVAGEGYLVVWECEGNQFGDCDYKRVL